MDRKFILIVRKTRLENLIVKFNTIQQAQFYIEHSGNDFSDYLEEDTQYKLVVGEVAATLERLGNIHVVDREYVANYIFGKKDIVVVVGQDGLVANTLKYLENQPLIGVNPDPKRWDGVLLPFSSKDVEKVALEVLKNQRRCKDITIAQVDLNDGQRLYAVNDIFIGQKTHVSARYTLQCGTSVEQQSSSGIIVSTGLGATGWFKSILSGASRITSHCIDYNIELEQSEPFLWDSNFLYYTVREPYPSKWTQANLVFGRIDNNNTFTVKSQMPEGGVIFSDGVESDFIQFGSGMEANVHIADKKGQLVV